MSFNNFVIRNSSKILESINVLGVYPPEDPLLMQEAEELVGDGGGKCGGKELPDKAIER